MSSLYELSSEWLQLLEIASSIPEDEESDVLNDTMEALDGEIEVKAENYCKVDKELEATELAISNEISRLKAKLDRVKTSRTRLKNNLKENMIIMGKDKIETDLFKISVRNNAPSLVIDNEDMVPDIYKTEEISVKIDKTAIKNDLKADNIENTKWCHLERGKSLMIK